MRVSQKICIGARKISASVGTIGIAVSPNGLGRLTLPNESLTELHIWAGKWYPDLPIESNSEDRRVLALLDQIQEYFEGKRKEFKVNLDLKGSPFQVAVWKGIWRVEFGRVISYSELAKSIERENAVRAVGGACGKNPVPLIVPCHRIVGASGALTGYSASGGLETKKDLLKREGHNY